MGNIIIVQHPQDLPTVKSLHAELDECRVWTFDPVLVDHIYYEGIHDAEYFPWEHCPDFAEVEKAGKKMAWQMEAELAAATKPYFPDCDIQGWQQLDLYYLHVLLQWYSMLWQSIEPMLSGHKVHVISCDATLRYYFNSNIPSMLLIERLATAGIEYQVHSYHVPNLHLYPADQVFNLSGLPPLPEKEFLFTHLPTCVYDLFSFNKELAAAKKHVINFQAKYFDMPARAEFTVPLTNLGAIWEHFFPEIQGQLNNIFDILMPHIDRMLAPWLKMPEHRQRQVFQLAKVYQAQFCNWILLMIYFAKNRPSKILLSDHDADFHGPLVSFAQNCNIPILLLPHAKTIAYVDFAYENMTALTHPMQGAAVLRANGNPVRQIPFFYPEERQPKARLNRPVKTVGLVLNSISLNGVFYARYIPYMKGIYHIVEWCKARNLELVIRGKPSYSIVRLTATHTGCNLNHLIECVLGKMEDFVQRCDVCLMYDTPTSGCIEFLQQAIPIFNPVIHPLSHAESTFSSAELIPRGEVQNILDQLDPLLQDEEAFEAFRMQQFEHYRQKFDQLAPLQAHL